MCYRWWFSVSPRMPGVGQTTDLLYFGPQLTVSLAVDHLGLATNEDKKARTWQVVQCLTTLYKRSRQRETFFKIKDEDLFYSIKSLSPKPPDSIWKNSHFIDRKKTQKQHKTNQKHHSWSFHCFNNHQLCSGKNRPARTLNVFKLTNKRNTAPSMVEKSTKSLN